MKTYPIDVINFNIYFNNGSNILIDTGSPVSFHKSGKLTIGEDTFSVPTSVEDEDIDCYNLPSVGFLVEGLLGMDYITGTALSSTFLDAPSPSMQTPTALKDGFTFRFGPKDRRHFTVFGVMDPVCGNLLSDSIKEAESWMKPGCRSVKFSVYYEGSLKDITPVCSHDGFNYYDVICDSEFLEVDQSKYQWFEIMATMGGIEPRDSSGSRTRVLLKMRKERPDVIYPYLFYVPGNELEQIQGTIKDDKNCLYFIETGETIAYEDYRDIHHKEVCSKAIEQMVNIVACTQDDAISQEINDDFTNNGKVCFTVNMKRALDSDGNPVVTMTAFGAERAITSDDAVDGYKVAGEWLVYQESVDLLNTKWKVLKEKWNNN